MPGVRLMGMEVGGYTREEAATLLAQQWQQKNLHIQGGETQLTVTLADM